MPGEHAHSDLERRLDQVEGAFNDAQPLIIEIRDLLRDRLKGIEDRLGLIEEHLRSRPLN